MGERLLKRVETARKAKNRPLYPIPFRRRTCLSAFATR